MRRRVAQLIANLERRRFLPRDSIGIDAVDQPNPDRIALRKIAHQLQTDVEVADHLEHPRAMHHALRQLAERHRALGDQHVRLQPRAARVGRRRRRGVAGRGADYRARALAQGLRDRQRHAPVLERAGRVGAFKLKVNLDVWPEPLCKRAHLDKRGVAFVERDHRRRIRHRQEAAVMLDQSGPVRQPRLFGLRAWGPTPSPKASPRFG